MTRLIDYTDQQIAAAVHFLEGHEDFLEGFERDAWIETKSLILHAAETAKEAGQ